MADIPIGRQMPYNLEAEQAVLGAMILDKASLLSAMEKLTEEDFYTTPHKTLFTTLGKMSLEGSPVDMVTLSEALGEKLETVGGMSYISRIVQGVLSTENLDYYIKIISGKSYLRRLIEAAGTIIDISTKDDEDVEKVLDRSSQLISDVIAGRTPGGLVHVSDVVRSTMNMLNELKKLGSNVNGVPTGFTQLDNTTAGLQKSDLIIIAARPGVGKTSLALNIATHAAMRANVPVAIFSLEMSREQLVMRIMSSEALIESGKMRTGQLDAEDMSSLGHLLQSLVTAPMYIDDSAGISVSEIRAKCARLKSEGKLGLVVIDYLQLMQGNRRSDNRAVEVADMSRALKIMAKDLNVPVVVLSQLNRASTQGKNLRPQISELRESGAIEQDADLIMLLYDPAANKTPEELEKENIQKGIVECIIAKHRQGENKTIDLGWRGEYTKFVNIDNRS